VTDTVDQSAKRPVLKCARCRKGALEFLTTEAALAPEPSYDIYRCLSCGFINLHIVATEG